MAPIAITIITGFLGSGKTTLILNLIPQLPPTYKLALLKNEFGDLAIDSQLAASSSISGVRELLNGCICCNLVGQLGGALEALRTEQNLDRIVIETSGSAFPATLAMEVNRISRETNGEHFLLDGVLSVIDVENWQGYDDTSVTAKLQAQYTDFVVFNKWENVGERRFDDCLDRLGDLGLQIPWVKSNKGTVGMDVVLGVDGALARHLPAAAAGSHSHKHNGQENHQTEVEVLSITLNVPPGQIMGINLTKLDELLRTAPKDEVYRMKAILHSKAHPKSSTGAIVECSQAGPGEYGRYILNWAFGRWTFTCIDSLNGEKGNLSTSTDEKLRPAIRMSMILARFESKKWTSRIEHGGLLELDLPNGAGMKPIVARIS